MAFSSFPRICLSFWAEGERGVFSLWKIDQCRKTLAFATNGKTPKYKQREKGNTFFPEGEREAMLMTLFKSLCKVCFVPLSVMVRGKTATSICLCYIYCLALFVVAVAAVCVFAFAFHSYFSSYHLNFCVCVFDVAERTSSYSFFEKGTRHRLSNDVKTNHKQPADRKKA